MYFHPSQLQYNLNEGQLDIYMKSENAFDFCQFTNAERKFIGIEEIISNNIKPRFSIRPDAVDKTIQPVRLR